MDEHTSLLIPDSYFPKSPIQNALTKPQMKESNIKTTWSGYHPDKDQLRTEIWSLLKEQGISLREPFGHIPTFVGSEQAAERLAALPIWQRAIAIKCNPDSPHIILIAVTQAIRTKINDETFTNQSFPFCLLLLQNAARTALCPLPSAVCYMCFKKQFENQQL
jgi:hypothetical protein